MKNSGLTGGKQQIVLKQTVLKEVRYQICSNLSLALFFWMYQVVNDKEGDINTKIIKSSDDIGPGRTESFRTDGIEISEWSGKFHEVDLRKGRWVGIGVNVSSPRNKLSSLKQKQWHGWGKC